MLRLYGSPRSRGIRVLWMATELGLSYDHKDYLPRSPETRTPEYRALNPNGRVPTIDDDGFILSESMAINFYLAKKHKSPLYPSDPKNEALALQNNGYEVTALCPHAKVSCQRSGVLVLIYNERRRSVAIGTAVLTASLALVLAIARSAAGQCCAYVHQRRCANFVQELCEMSSGG